MRNTVITVLVLGVVALIAAFALGLIDVNQTKKGALPEIKAQGGQLPGFDVKTGDVQVGTTNKSIDLPTVKTEKKNIELPTVDVKKAH